MRTNIFDVLIGRDTLKWDGVWRAIEWLATRTEGHGLESSFSERLSDFCFGTPLPLELKVEFFLGVDAQEKQKWPDMALAYPAMPESKEPDPKIRYFAMIDDLSRRSPNDSRKLHNLEAYARLARARFPKATLSVIAVTDTINADRFLKAKERMSTLNDCTFKMLPLPEIASWIPEGRGTNAVQDFRSWAASFGSSSVNGGV